MKQFANFYQIQKTLRFELQPIGKTLEHIQNKGILTKDEIRAINYQKAKKIIDDYHKYFIELALQNVQLTKLNDFADLYFATPERKKEDSYKKELEKVQSALRKDIASAFKSGEAKEIFEKIDKKELFTELLEKWIIDADKKEIIEDFKTFTTYFQGFHQNRKNIYTDEAKATAIAYRLIHENLPKFLDNIRIFEKVKEVPELYEKCTNLYNDIQEYLNIKKIDEAFTVEYYNNVLTQKQIDVYNLIITGRIPDEGKRKIQGLNEYINLYNQQQRDKKNKIPKLKILYKQLLSDRENISFLPEKFEDDNLSTASQKVLNAINFYYRDNLLDFKADDKEYTENVLQRIKELLAELTSYNLDKIFIRNDNTLTDISQKIFGDWSIIKSALEYSYLKSISIGKNGLTKKQVEEKEKHLKQSHFSIAEIEKALFIYKEQNDALNQLPENSHPIAEYFKNNFKAKKKEESDKEFDLIANIEAKYRCVQGLLNTHYPTDKKLYQDKKVIEDIKAFLDSILELLHFVKPLALPDDNTLEKDESFYSQFEVYYAQLKKLIPLYNKVRNFATQKAYSVEKFKLNFDNATLLGGWDKNKEIDNTSLILRKNGFYYLAIMPQDNKNVFKNISELKENEGYYEKMDYKQIALPMGFGAFVRKCYGTATNLGWYCPESCKNKEGKIIIKEDEIKGNRAELIDCYKEFLNVYEKDGFRYKEFGFKFKKSNEYKTLNEFFKDVELQGYKIDFRNISESYINQLVEEGKLYLFKIYNKDFSPYSKGKPNMHTMYWKALFDPENLKNVVYKLNGQAEVFYRKKSIDNPTIHKANEPIVNKNPNAIKKESTFKYDLIKDKRYTLDKFQFHVPITLNFKAIGTENINNKVLDYLKKSQEDINIIGLDRGERHLIYLTRINSKGEILNQETLNIIENENQKLKTDYHLLLKNKEEERAKARQNWGVIENIKELKEGYISQIVHKIAKMMVEYNAIVVMEDLNTGFKRGRFKVERQVYQKFEKMLIDKLNYLVFKDKPTDKPGGLYHALQLTNKFTSFKEMGKQNGFLFYVPAWNTSKIDPTTGFVNLFDTRYENIDKSKKFFENFKSIRFNGSYFEFEVDDYSKFNPKAEGTRLEWVICTYGDRIKTFRNPQKNNQWDNCKINLTEEFEDFFGKHGILYGDGKCIKDQIIEKEDKEFFKGLLELFRLTVQMRNSITDSSNPEDDFLISPVKNKKGEFYDSRKADNTLPKDADANGAYHIAKKGLMWLNQIKAFDGENWKNLKLEKTNNAWLNFVQNQNI
ncbi:MAG: type V CRISPR-associated protein Cas12a/Cpf1 [Bacteroidia bacterium]